MSKHTVLRLNDGLNLERILDAIREGRFDLTPEDEDWPAEERLYANWVSATGRAFEINTIESILEFPTEYIIGREEEEPVTITIENEYEINYNEQILVAETVIKRPRMGWYDYQDRLLPLDKRTNFFGTEVVFFTNDNNAYVAIQGSPKSDKVNRTKNDLLIPCNLLNQITGIRTDELGLPTEMNFASDFFYWLYYIYQERERIIPCAPMPIFIIELSGFHGTALEDTQKTKSFGDRISKLLTTNAFIFADDDLKALRLSLQYGNEIIELELHHDGSVDLLSYHGVLGNTIPQYKTQNVIVYIYKILLPLLLETYGLSVNNGSWSRTVRDEFLHKIGMGMIDNITEALATLIPNRIIAEDNENQSA
ncbi:MULTISPECIES: hypothetical protein [Bacillus cereus group]|uniref:hypothetical protein n=1 Tax=Bacillus cereus group TaxID=86661 RepID=UPI0008727185|nr:MULTISPECIES: hypothetical protein [Bacillus cereus group]OFC87122.1 hypothetical protein BTGOE3_19010 [Bacillus thuringiensis]PEB29398.1 hypothetical protein COO14_14600 [Bacillus toyonensis]PEC38387.1 hypothetical protein CON60_16615 [Bacillus toyonensis]PEP63900.1 hypothetical protein CN574_15615 [Bacillus toyonensis]